MKETEAEIASGADRATVRTRLRAAGRAFVAGGAFEAANRALAAQLRRVVDRLEPEVLGLYWALPSEFNAAAVFAADAGASLALPAARRDPPRLAYRRWDGAAPRAVDDHGLATADGAEVVPDVVLVPCVGFRPEGDRLGHGGGYFDRWLAAHPGVTAVGVAWSCAELGAGDFTRAAHDVPLALIVTERGVAG